MLRHPFMAAFLAVSASSLGTWTIIASWCLVSGVWSFDTPSTVAQLAVAAVWLGGSALMMRGAAALWHGNDIRRARRGLLAGFLCPLPPYVIGATICLGLLAKHGNAAD